MEKIIYNTKLKKLISVIILVMLLLNFMVPCVGLAATENNCGAQELADITYAWQLDSGKGYAFTKKTAQECIEQLKNNDSNVKLTYTKDASGGYSNIYIYTQLTYDDLYQEVFKKYLDQGTYDDMFGDGARIQIKKSSSSSTSSSSESSSESSSGDSSSSSASLQAQALADCFWDRKDY